MVPDARWDGNDLKARFNSIAESAETYIRQISGRDPGAADEVLLAEQEAKFYIYYYLSSTRALISREDFVAELRRMLSVSPDPPIRKVNRAYFKQWYEHYVKDLLERYGL